MSIEFSETEPAPAAYPGPGAEQLGPGIIARADGVYADPGAGGAVLISSVDSIFGKNRYFGDIDYPAFIQALYNHGPARERAGDLLRIAASVELFMPERRALYKAVKISSGRAEYYFEPVYIADPNDAGSAGVLARLDPGEFVADLWGKGIRFGIDMAAVSAAIASNKSERTIVAEQCDAVPGIDAHVIEVSEDLHRSDAPRQLANGKLDLMAFQNRFPQIQQGARLLKKIPRSAGENGYDLAGRALEPALPNDVDLNRMTGPGTKVEVTADGEFLVAMQNGFLNVDRQSTQVSVGDKIVSRDGVSARTTGNLQLEGDYEEFGEVQEKRVIEGEGITVHADVFGNIVSRGGAILLNKNLVGGSAHNALGNITVNGVASAAIIQAAQGDVRLQRAESCVISGTRVFVEHAVNCEIIGDDVVINQAEGCAVAGRRVQIESAGARKQSEMLVFVLQPDCQRIDDVILQIGERVAMFAQAAAQRKEEMQALQAREDVRMYMQLATRVRKGELVLSPEQAPQFQKMGAAVAPSLKAIGKLSEDIKAAETEHQAGSALVEQLKEQRRASAGGSSVRVGSLTGETAVHAIKYQPNGDSTYDLTPKEIKAKLRATVPQGECIFAGSTGSVDWDSGLK
ncbi:flagellar assembly protein A [Massilia soli]|uniref:FapA family protein n=1 Tax=Massilia soli TaxID=2792854 RepID=A0ABS7SQC3_9BURK|nr:flagellar assembly protein A [Massilia soli]MBZ2208190.1 FapA family protein [Massilia soli]